MGLFGPSREERLAGAAAALAPYGFAFDARQAARVRQYVPFKELSTPEHCVTACFGQIEDAHVEAYEYESSSTDSDGNTTWTTTTLVAVQHPAVMPGGASFRPDLTEWSTTVAVLNMLAWVPPFTIVKAIQLIAEARNPDRTVGDKDFDRLYVVHAPSDAHARAAIPPPLREAVLKLAFRGAVELRPGLLLYAPYSYRFDAQTAVSAVGVATVLLAAMRAAPSGGHPMR